MPWANTGQEMWDEFVKLHHNVRFVLNGHVSVCERRVGDLTERYYPCDWNVGFRHDTRPDGSSVWAMLANYQNAATGYMRLLTFDTVTGDVDVTTYSPWLDIYPRSFTGHEMT